jgi:hypothetical protein
VRLGTKVQADDVAERGWTRPYTCRRKIGAAHDRFTDLLQRRTRTSLPSEEACHDRFLSRTAGYEVQRVHRLRLANPIYSADALFEAQRAPGQLQVHDEATAFLEVQSLARGIRREQESRRTFRKLPRRGLSLTWRHAAVERYCRDRQSLLEMCKRVAILREHEHGLVHAAKQANERGDLAFMASSLTGKGKQASERSLFFRCVVETRRPEQQRWLLVTV